MPLFLLGLVTIFFSGVSGPEKTGSSRKIQVGGGSQRRPYRWWKGRACIEENNAWGKRLQSLDVRIALAICDEKKELLRSAIEERNVDTTWDPIVAERMKRERQERKAAMAVAKQERMKQEEEAHRCRVLADRDQFNLHEALFRVGCSPGERTFTDDWMFWHGFEPEKEAVVAARSKTAKHGNG